MKRELSDLRESFELRIKEANSLMTDFSRPLELAERKNKREKTAIVCSQVS